MVRREWTFGAGSGWSGRKSEVVGRQKTARNVMRVKGGGVLGADRHGRKDWAGRVRGA